MRMVLKYLFWLCALGLFLGGVHNARQLYAMRVPADEFQAGAGQVLAVEARRDQDPGHGQASGGSRMVYRVWFQYQLDGRVYRAGTLSPACEECEADDVQRITGKPPQQLAAGDAVTVYVRRGAPQQAYLALASAAEIRAQWWAVLLWLCVGPLAAIAASRIDWTRSESETKE
jgi:hypothetical protein